jgi:hypothetical protein
MKCILICALFVLMLAGGVSARIWYVKPDSTGDAVNIQAGIDSCGAGDTVLVAGGVYHGDGNRDLDFRGKPIIVIGESRYDPAVTDSSVIDCSDVLWGHRGFHFHSGETNAAVLEGLVIINGQAYPGGGGIFCDSASSPTIRFNMIRDNRAAYTGGGIYCQSSAPIISNNTICANGAEDGGGVGCRESSPTIIDNWIIANRGWVGAALNQKLTLGHLAVWGGAGGIDCYQCPKIILERNVCHNNFGFLAGAILVWGSSALIRDNDIQCNGSEGVGGIYAYGCTVTIVGNNICKNGGPAITIWSNSSAVIDSNHIYQNCYHGVSNDGQPCVHIYESKGLIRGNEIGFNSAAGIAYQSDSTGCIENNLVENNGNYGGIYCLAPIPISGNVVRNNYSSEFKFIQPGGGGIRCTSSAVITGNLVASNSTGAVGGGIYCLSGSPVVANNTIVGNSAALGSGIYVESQCAATLSGNIVANNRLYDGGGWYPCDGGGIYSDTAKVDVSCCDVYGNEGGNYVGIPDQTGLNGNFSADPLFCEPLEGDYTLNILSPCLPGRHPYGASCGLIGAFGVGCEVVATLLREYQVEGDGAAITVTWRLSQADNRLAFSVLRAEMPGTEYQEISGALINRETASFSFRDATCKPGATYRYRVDLSDEDGRRVLFETEPVSLLAARLALDQNYPNPFNPSTSIRYELPERTSVRVEVYDVSGARVATLADAEQERGPHMAVWNGLDEVGRPAASGVYFCRLTAGKQMISRKMVLLR